MKTGFSLQIPRRKSSDAVVALLRLFAGWCAVASPDSAEALPEWRLDDEGIVREE